MIYLAAILFGFKKEVSIKIIYDIAVIVINTKQVFSIVAIILSFAEEVRAFYKSVKKER